MIGIYYLIMGEALGKIACYPVGRKLRVGSLARAAAWFKSP